MRLGVVFFENPRNQPDAKELMKILMLLPWESNQHVFFVAQSFFVTRLSSKDLEALVSFQAHLERKYGSQTKNLI